MQEKENSQKANNNKSLPCESGSVQGLPFCNGPLISWRVESVLMIISVMILRGLRGVDRLRCPIKKFSECSTGVILLLNTEGLGLWVTLMSFFSDHWVSTQALLVKVRIVERADEEMHHGKDELNESEFVF